MTQRWEERFPPLPRVPVHVGIIMDGNGRWAVEQGRPRTYGHRAGVENIRRVLQACARFGVKVLTGDEIRWGMENLNITEERIAELGLTGFMSPIKTSCENHEGGKIVLFQQWDGEKWISAGTQTPMEAFVQARHKESALKYAKEQGIEVRECK